VLAGHPEAVGAVECDVDREPLGFEAPLQARGETLLILDDEHAHAASLWSFPERTLNAKVESSRSSQRRFRLARASCAHE
jgi:hypothetical protein